MNFFLSNDSSYILINMPTFPYFTTSSIYNCSLMHFNASGIVLRLRLCILKVKDILVLNDLPEVLFSIYIELCIISLILFYCFIYICYFNQVKNKNWSTFIQTRCGGMQSELPRDVSSHRLATNARRWRVALPFRFVSWGCCQFAGVCLSPSCARVYWGPLARGRDKPTSRSIELIREPIPLLYQWSSRSTCRMSLMKLLIAMNWSEESSKYFAVKSMGRISA